MSAKIPNGPIPGENYTSDTKNYPWHRPPEITDLDAGVEYVVKKLTSREQSHAFLTIVQSGVTIVQAVQMFLMNGVGSGKWTPDFALMLAGPTSHMMKIMADSYGAKYDMGLDEDHMPTIAFFKEVAKLDPKKAVTAVEDVQAQIEAIKENAGQQQAPKAGGFMGMGGPLNVDPQAEPMMEETAVEDEPIQEGMV